LIADPEILEPGDTSTIIVDAVDPDGDALSYSVEISGGEITGEGPRWTWTAPMIEGIFSLNVTVKDQNGANAFMGITIVVEESTPTNSDPVIRSFTASSYILIVEDSTDLEVEAFDPDGDQLVYEYTASDGRISGSGNSVEFIAPDAEGMVTVEVIVTDGKGGEARNSLIIDVVLRPRIEPPEIIDLELSVGSIPQGDRNSELRIEVIVRENTYPINGVYADLSDLKQQNHKSMIFEGLADRGGSQVIEYSLEIRNLHGLEAGNYSIIVTAEDERNYVSNPVEATFMISAPEILDNGTYVDERSSKVTPWMLILIGIIVLAVVMIMFIAARKIGSRKKGSENEPDPTNTISYHAIEIT
jgi:hypothetical protein